MQAAVCVTTLAFALAACDGGSKLNEDDNTFHVRTLNLIENSPTLEIDLDTTTIGSAAYGGATGFSAGHPGRHDVSFAAVLPEDLDDDDDDDEDTTPAGQPVTYTFLNDTDYTLIAYGRLDNPQTYLVEGFDQRDSPADDKVVLHFTHAATDAAEVQVYVTARQAGITTRQYVDTLGMTESATPLELTVTRDDDDLDDDSTLVVDVVVELVAVSSGQTVYRSKAISIAEQKRVLFTIANTVGPEAASVKLVLAGGVSGEYLDRNDGAALRLVHVAREAPALDVTVGSSFADPLAQNISFRQRTVYRRVNSGEVGMIAVATGSPGVFVFLEEFTATAGQYYSAYAIGPLIEVDGVVISTDARSVPTQTRFRFLHAASSLESEDALDIYLRLPGVGVDFDDDDTTPTYSSIAYQTTTNYTTLMQGSYDVYFAYAGSSTIVLGPASFQISNGQVQTLVLLDSETGARELLSIPDVAE